MNATTTAELTKIAEGREAEIFAWEPGVVLKLYRTMAWMRSRDIERAAMEAVRASGEPGAVPASLGEVEVDGRPGLLMERVEGVDMLTEMGKKPWTIFRAGTTMGRVQASLHTTAAPATLESLTDRLRRQIELVRPHSAELSERGLLALAALPDGDRLCHGDFHPGNMILTQRGPAVIDWPNSTRGDPTADVARTLLMLRLGELPPGSPLPLRVLARLGRTILKGRYLSAYRSTRPIDMQLVRRWMVPVAIARLTEGIEEERERLLRFIDDL